MAWRSLKQGAVALSTTEAEFMSLGEGTKMVIWLRHLLKELDCEKTESTPIFEDNQGAVVWESEGVRHAKHISIRKSFVRDNVQRGIIRIIYSSTKNMVADIITKPLSRLAFERNRHGLGIFLSNA